MAIRKIVLRVTGMTCASCALNNEKALTKTAGITSANVNFASKKALVEYDDAVLDAEQVKKIIIDNGYNIDENSKLQIPNSKQIQNTKSQIQNFHE
ncbi:MAG: heavy metal-associated domain-containing protein, partial [Candidatus Moranbacteria bacterium]|nr:heavy metal-associated domain-containing protein [Candidatus Moranbacteria bacterium]